MDCPKCKEYVYDVLVQPVHPHDRCFKRYKHSRFIQMIPQLFEVTCEVLKKCPPSEYQECRQMEMFSFYYGESIQSMFQTRLEPYQYRSIFMHSIRTFLYFKRRNPQLYMLLNDVLYIAMGHCILSKSVSIQDYEEWYSQKFIFLLYYLPSLHSEHDPR
jgi:hypothetical protein